MAMRSSLPVVLSVLAAGAVLSATADAPRPVASHPQAAPPASAVVAPQAVIERSCVTCHNDRAKAGGLSLAGFSMASAGDVPEITEKMIRKVRAGQMPPAGGARDESALTALAAALEAAADAHASAASPGRRSFQRLNRAEYAQSVRDLLGLDVNAGDYLPLDTKMANFDNVADAQILSPTVMQSYLTAAAEISRLAVGDRSATAKEVSFLIPRTASQREQVEGAPVGTRGGLSVLHTFPADGEYRVRVSFYHETTGALYGNGRAALHTAEKPEQVEVSIDGARVALLDVDRWMNSSDPDGVNLRTEPVRITAGTHRVTAAFLTRFEGPVQDLITPLDWSIASTSIADAYGFTTLPHLRDMAITGPFSPTGVSETAVRRRIFPCHPEQAAQQLQCAQRIIGTLASQAFRRRASEKDVNALMDLYRQGAAEHGFEEGVRMALEGILASPKFVFRFEGRPAGVRDGQGYAVTDVDLASRLSFFLWAAAPDAELMRVAEAGRLSQAAELERQVRRMLADPRADVLASRFAAQWLRLQDLDDVSPDPILYPYYDRSLGQALQQETELFIASLVRDDKSVLDLLTADYTYANEKVAQHYGIGGVTGTQFRRVALPPERRGILGHGSVLTLTSIADRTSPVQRGKWIMEVLLGSPPPAPPPNVPALEETKGTADGKVLTVRERMETHRKNPACMSCHKVIDPLGLALENFDATGRHRINDSGMTVDAVGVLYDGTTMEGAEGLRRALLKHKDAFLLSFTEHMMTYALGRRVEASDMPAVRAVIRGAAKQDYRVSAFVRGIVASAPFQKSIVKAAGPVTTDAGQR